MADQADSKTVHTVSEDKHKTGPLLMLGGIFAAAGGILVALLKARSDTNKVQKPNNPSP